MKNDKGPFGMFAEEYRAKGFYVRPARGKRPFIPNWQKPDSYFSGEAFEEWVDKYGDCNIGIVSGSALPDGSCLGFFDIDSDQYSRLGRVIFGQPKCVRFGKKGLVIALRYKSGLKVSKKIKVSGTDNGEEIAEFLVEGAFCVVPPSIHPDTGNPYRWEGASLIDLDFNDLPLIGE